MKSITIFTPTFNREKVIKRLYFSLKGQTCKDFVWLIIDDGSTDYTKKNVDSWISENIIEIRYVKQKNSGKSMAHNRAVQITDTELFLCLDSNDFLSSNAVEVILNCWNKVKSDKNTIGILSPKKAQFQDVVKTMNIRLLPKLLKIKHDKKPCEKAFGDKYYIEEEKERNGYVKTQLREAYRLFGLKGEAMLVFKTTVISKYQFPYIEGEKFVPEAYLYDLTDKEGRLAVINRTLCVHRYQTDGYTFNMSKLIKDNPKGYLMYICNRLQEEENEKARFGDYIRYISVARIVHAKGVVKNATDKKTALMAYPFGCLLYLIRYKGA